MCEAMTALRVSFGQGTSRRIAFSRYPVEAELRAMARKELLAEVEKDGIAIGYMGFDLRNPNTKSRRGFGYSVFAGSSACAEFAASLIVDWMVSPAQTSIQLESHVACKDFWHQRLETAIHEWDRRQQVQGDWPPQCVASESGVYIG